MDTFFTFEVKLFFNPVTVLPTTRLFGKLLPSMVQSPRDLLSWGPGWDDFNKDVGDSWKGELSFDQRSKASLKKPSLLKRKSLTCTKSLISKIPGVLFCVIGWLISSRVVLRLAVQFQQFCTLRSPECIGSLDWNRMKFGRLKWFEKWGFSDLQRLSSEQNPSYLLYKGDYTTQRYRDWGPYEPISIMESHKGFELCSNGFWNQDFWIIWMMCLWSFHSMNRKLELFGCCILLWDKE